MKLCLVEFALGIPSLSLRPPRPLANPSLPPLSTLRTIGYSVIHNKIRYARYFPMVFHRVKLKSDFDENRRHDLIVGKCISCNLTPQSFNYELSYLFGIYSV